MDILPVVLLGGAALILLAVVYWQTAIVIVLVAAAVGGICYAAYRDSITTEKAEKEAEYKQAVGDLYLPDGSGLVQEIQQSWDIPADNLATLAAMYESAREVILQNWAEYYANPSYYPRTRLTLDGMTAGNFHATIESALEHRDAAYKVWWYFVALGSYVGRLYQLPNAAPSPGLCYWVNDPNYLENVQNSIDSLLPDWGTAAYRYGEWAPRIDASDLCSWAEYAGFVEQRLLDLEGDIRFEHEWVIAPPGAGKTTLLQTQIAEDLERVAQGECSIIVIDSQNQLIPKIAHLQLFAPGQPLHGKLVLIEPDPDYPPALNVLDIGLSDLNARDRFRMQAEALENIKSCLATMADVQDDMLSYLVELCFVIPGATIQTIVDILKPNGLEAYRPYLDKVDQTCRDYLEITFSARAQGTNPTKDALLRRLMGMLRNPTFRRMFLNERNKFSMAKELQTSKVILINTDIEFLRRDACQLFGRFFIAQLLQAAETRGSHSLPVFCYVDECQDYISNDENAARLMDKARKRRVGMIFAHQRIRNIESTNVIDALSNVGVRFAGGNETDAKYLANIFRTDAEFIAHKERGNFACFVRRQTKEAIEVAVPPDVLENMPRMTDTEYRAIKTDMRTRYCQFDHGQKNSKIDRSQKNANIVAFVAASRRRKAPPKEPEGESEDPAAAADDF